MRVFNVDLSSEAPFVGKISSVSDLSSSKDTNDNGSANDRATPPSPSATSSSSSFFNSGVSKESVMQRLFRRASAGLVYILYFIYLLHRMCGNFPLRDRRVALN